MVQSPGPGVEESLYDSMAMRRVVGIDLGREPVLDETTMCRFGHLLEEHERARWLFDKVQQHLAEKGPSQAAMVEAGRVAQATGIGRRAAVEEPDG